MSRGTGKTATAPAIPSTHGQGNGELARDDDGLLLEALRIASAHITREADACEGIMPGSNMVERLRLFSQRMDSLHTRLSA